LTQVAKMFLWVFFRPVDLSVFIPHLVLSFFLSFPYFFDVIVVGQ
jgi:hypothetical protein